MTRYAAKLLFQFRVDVAGNSGKRRICEERIIQFAARSPREALKRAKRRGVAAEYAYVNGDGYHVAFEFVGILDMLRLGIETADDEVWHDIRERLLPMERRAEILPDESALLERLVTP